ncbi:MAG: hypothetical protein ACRDFB_04140 [Rhabdochlamydiaceae bacterium]
MAASESNPKLRLEEFRNTAKELQAAFYVRAFSTETFNLQPTLRLIYNYSSEAFQNSRWRRCWLSGPLDVIIDYKNRISPQEWSLPEMSSKVIYVEIKLLHQCQKWQSCLFEAGKMVDYSAWTKVNLFFTQINKRVTPFIHPLISKSLF